jgi:hypothetical protein
MRPIPKTVPRFTNVVTCEKRPHKRRHCTVGDAHDAELGDKGCKGPRNDDHSHQEEDGVQYQVMSRSHHRAKHVRETHSPCEDRENGRDNGQRDDGFGGDGLDDLLLTLHLVDRIISLHPKCHDSSIVCGSIALF